MGPTSDVYELTVLPSLVLVDQLGMLWVEVPPRCVSVDINSSPPAGAARGGVAWDALRMVTRRVGLLLAC